MARKIKNEKPVISDQSFSIDENAPNGALVGTVLARDPDGDALTYTIVNGNNDGAFAINSLTGVITVVNGSLLNHESVDTRVLTIRVADQESSKQATITIAVSDVNEAPTGISLGNTSVDENVGGAVVGSLSVIDPDNSAEPFGRHSFSVDDARFEVAAGQLKLKDGVSIDFETEPSLTVQVTATDGGGLSTSQSFTITVNNLNEAPTGITLDNSAVDENAAGAVIGNVTVADPDANDAHSFSVNDVRFEVVAGQLKLKDGVSLDFETEPSVAVDVTATDTGGLSTSESFTITVNDIRENMAPTAKDDVVSGDLDLFLTRSDAKPNLVYLNDGIGGFTNSGQLIGNSWSHGASVGDIDGDGDLDVAVANRFNQPIRFWLNDGSGDFSAGQSLSISGSDFFDVALGDIDGDGDLDAFVANAYSRPNVVLINNGFGVFADSGQRLGLDTTIGVSLGDLDGDGDLDAFVANHFSQPNRVYLNNGSGLFSDSGQAIGADSSSFATLVDIDNDGDLDAIVGNLGSPNRIYLNDGNAVFSSPGQAIGGNELSSKIAVGDLDGDGDLDLYVANRNNQPDQVFLNDGLGNFINTGQNIGAADSVNVALSDIDFDGDLDAVVSSFTGTSRVFVNNGAGNFTDSGMALGDTRAWDVELADFDRDGISEDRSITLDVLANDTDPERDRLSIGGFDQTSSLGATISLNARGQIVYDPTNAAAIQALGQGETIIDSFTYRASDGQVESNEATVTVKLRGVNDAPTAVDLDNASVNENTAGAVIGNVTVADPDANDNHSFSVNDARFEVVAGQLKLKDGVSLDFETEPFVSVQITATDGGGLSSSQFFTITVNDVNEFAGVIDLANLAPADGFRILGAKPFDQSGFSVSSAGDVNGDGFDDLIIGAPSADVADNLVSHTGESYVIFGKAGGFADIDLASFAPVDGFRILGTDSSDGLGFSVSSAGDVNGDGFDDLVIGAPGAKAGHVNSGYGVSYVVFGKAAGFTDINVADFSSVDGFRVLGADNEDLSGWSVSSAGDVNGDGFSDLIIGAWRAYSASDSRPYAGESYVIFGKAAGFSDIDLANLEPSDGIRILGVDPFDRSGWSVSSAGDINGDSFDDLIIGAYSADAEGNGKNGAGETYVVFGKAGGFVDIDLSNLSSGEGFRIFGAASLDQSGFSVSGAGDVNGDGFDDIIIGAPNANPDDNLRYGAGESYVIFGKAGGFIDLDLASLDVSDGFRILGGELGDNTGWSVSGAGDVNGDGFDDLIIGAVNADSENNERGSAGESYVIFGKQTGFTEIDLANLDPSDGFRILGADAGDFSGYSVSSAGDLNGDGFDDLIIGAMNAGAGDNLKSAAGESYVIFGRDFTGVSSLSLADADLLM